jgi:hypothetical protein
MQKFATYRSCQYPKHRSDSEVQSDQNDQAICSQISSNVELLPQFFALHHHGDPGHGTSDSGQFENPAVGVARGDVLGVVVRIHIDTLRGAARRVQRGSIRSTMLPSGRSTVICKTMKQAE